MINWSSYTRF